MMQRSPYVDYHIGRLRDVAENVAGAENITWIITADHGKPSESIRRMDTAYLYGIQQCRYR